MRTIRLISAFILLTAFGAAAQTRDEKQAIVSEEIIFPLQNEHTHGSSIVSLPNGDLLAAWFQGNGERHADDVRIMGARLKKGTKTWSSPFLMADTKGIPDCNPVLFLNQKGKLFLFWIAVQANEWQDAILRFRTSVNFSGNEAPVWNWQDNILLKPDDSFAAEVDKRFKELPENEAGWAAYAPPYDDMVKAASKDLLKRSIGWMTRIHPVTLASGRILLPLYSDGLNFSLVAISDDDGETWRPSLPIVGRGPIQPALAVKKNGDIVAYMRDSGDSPTRVQVSTSTDNGESWSAALKSDIPNEASVEVCVMKDGRWAMVNNDLNGGRYQLSLAISNDEGATWKWKDLVEYDPTKKGGFSYPCLIQTSDGLLNLTYSYSPGDRKESIKHVVIDPDKIATKTWAEKLGFPSGKTVLLLHMDDAGMCPEANTAVENYISNKQINSTAVMIPCPNAKDMIDWAKKHPSADIGLHLTLTSEWGTYRWGPVSNPKKVPGLIDPDGKLWHEVPDVVKHASAKEVETEIRAQIDQSLKWGYKPSHIDTHMGTLYGSPEYVKVFLKTAEDYRLPANAIDLSDPEVVSQFRKVGYPITDDVIKMMEEYSLPKLDNFTSVPGGKTYEEKRDNFFTLVKSLKPGLTEIIFHPSVLSENLKTITHSWQQRVWESELFADPAVQKFMQNQGIIFTDWTDIMKRFEGKK
ncbi:MAG: ChbG/HpnK family deacetylase [Prolixibacteraceae bacterium]|jgi:predicted glycoside hydrolase/deacetylase ChbG (UPF0249 family)/predicted neuraminidase